MNTNYALATRAWHQCREQYLQTTDVHYVQVEEWQGEVEQITEWMLDYFERFPQYAPVVTFLKRDGFLGDLLIKEYSRWLWPPLLKQDVLRDAYWKLQQFGADCQ